jgi:hypothetical protein
MCHWRATFDTVVRKIKSTVSQATANTFLRRLIATIRSGRVSRAFRTSRIPPDPRGARVSYGPSLYPAAIDIIEFDDFTAAQCAGRGLTVTFGSPGRM